MTEILLSTLNARHQHTAFGLRYLLANLGELRARTTLREFTINEQALDIVDAMLSHAPRLIGLGVYIWNAIPTLAVVQLLKRIRPQITIVLGGPEVSHEWDQQELVSLADYVICGEADLAFRDLASDVLDGTPPTTRIIHAAPPPIEALALPYALYTSEDIAQRMIYVEASRGCPFKCEFCLSSLDNSVRKFPLPGLLAELERLLAAGARQFKFIDRTFNLSVAHSQAILAFFLARYQPGLFLHFEMVPDRLPEALRTVISAFPVGALQLEVGVQTFNPDVADRISRRQDYHKLTDNLIFLRQETGVHLHTDLIVGLPGEDEASFAAGFDQLISLNPQEIQVGILKRLRGSPISRHTGAWGMVYRPQPPYDVLQTSALPFETLQRMRRFARYWDLVGNSGNFAQTRPLIWGDASPYAQVMALSEWLFATLGRTHKISLLNLCRAVFGFLTTVRQLPEQRVATAMLADYHRGGRGETPRFLKAGRTTPAQTPLATPTTLPTRQARHILDGD